MTLKKLSLKEFLELYDESVHDKLKKVLNRDGVSALVDFVCNDMSSSQLGTRTAMAVGSGCTYKTVEEIEGQRLGDVPSRFKYAENYVLKEDKVL